MVLYMTLLSKDKKRFRIVKWIFLGISILCNAFIIYHSCLNSTDSGKWSQFFANIFEAEINKNHKEVMFLYSMLNDKEMQRRVKAAVDAGVPIVNYGVAIAKMNGILERSLEPVKKSM